MDRVPSFELKLQRAVEHLECLKHAVRLWGDTKPCEAVDERDPEPPPKPLPDGYLSRRVRVTRFEPVPVRFSLLVGDCLFNLRSALDHLALALARKNTPTMTDKQVEGSEFPIFTKVMSDETETRKIGCMAQLAIAGVKKLQPYHRESDYSTHPLWIIHDLNRID